MIAVRCSNCGRLQELEKAFAGCICRCRFCRAIQTVPRDSPAVPAGQEPRVPQGAASQPILLHCPEPSAGRRRREDKADRTLVLAIGIAAVLVVGAAGGVLALLRGAAEEPPGDRTDVERVRLDSTTP
jgi:hypothetical protein